MANISFANLTRDFSMWREEIDNHATEKLPNSFATLTASDHIVTIQGTNLEYQNGVPRNGHVDSLGIKLGGLKEFADISITGIDTDFIDYANMVAAPNPIDRTMAMWSATLAGNDTIDFGDNASGQFYIHFAGDGYEAPANRLGGNDSFRGDVFEGSVAGDFMSIGAGREAHGGNDDIQLSKSRQAAVTGDIFDSAYGSYFVGGNDTIKLDDYGSAIGDAADVFGALEAGNDTLFGGDENDILVGDVNIARSTSSIRYGDDAIHGGDGDDTISGDHQVNYSTNFTAGNDKLYGDGGNDYVYGNEGNDTIDGGTGNDSLIGGAGTDIIRGGEGNDTMNGSAGVDTADYRDKTVSVEVRFDGSGSGQVKVGGVVEDQIEQFENLTGGSAGDKLFGFALYGDNVLEGRAGNDTLNGGGGRDILIGGAGKDKLVGGIGADQFRFDAKLGSTNIDKIVDFTRGTDKIGLDDVIFRALGSSFEKSEFVALSSGHSATNGSQHVIYDKAHGSLWYDSDGKGGHAAVQFAQLGTASSHPETLNWHDFAIV
jgi:Ca2+-binding RTX toxin-like protein